MKESVLAQLDTKVLEVFSNWIVWSPGPWNLLAWLGARVADEAKPRQFARTQLIVEVCAFFIKIAMRLSTWHYLLQTLLPDAICFRF